MFQWKNFPLEGDNTHRHTGAYPLKIMGDAFYFVLLLYTIALIETPENKWTWNEPTFMIQQENTKIILKIKALELDKN